MIREIVFILSFVLLFFSACIYAQRESEKKFIASLDIEQYSGTLLDNMFDIYPDIGISLFHNKALNVYCKLSISCKLTYVYTNFSALGISLESHYNREKFSLISSLGVYNAGPMGLHVPLMFGVNYNINNSHSIGAHIRPILISYVSGYYAGKQIKTFPEVYNFSLGISYYIFIE